MWAPAWLTSAPVLIERTLYIPELHLLGHKVDLAPLDVNRWLSEPAIGDAPSAPLTCFYAVRIRRRPLATGRGVSLSCGRSRHPGRRCDRDRSRQAPALLPQGRRLPGRS